MGSCFSGLFFVGESGRGTGEHFGLEGEVDLVMGTFSKSLATPWNRFAGEAQPLPPEGQSVAAGPPAGTKGFEKLKSAAVSPVTGVPFRVTRATTRTRLWFVLAAAPKECPLPASPH